MLSPRNEHHFLGAAIGSAIGGIFGALQQSSANRRANRANFLNTQITNMFNMKEAQKQRDWQEKMVDESRKYNSPEAMISRGLNPFVRRVIGIIHTPHLLLPITLNLRLFCIKRVLFTHHTEINLILMILINHTDNVVGKVCSRGGYSIKKTHYSVGAGAESGDGAAFCSANIDSA